MAKSYLPLLSMLSLAALPLAAQSVDVTESGGLVSIRCNNAPLSSVFAQMGATVGIELILENEVKNKRLTADLVDVPVAMAVQRLLEGKGVNFAVMMDPSNWARVDKIFVGAGGGGPARAAAPPPPPRPTAPPPAPEDDGYGDTADAFDNTAAENQLLDTLDEQGVAGDPNAQGGQDGAQGGEVAPPPPAPSYLPPQQSFPRSNFTPGLPAGQQNPQGAGNASPFPYLDALGRPIPPPTPNAKQQQQRQQK